MAQIDEGKQIFSNPNGIINWNETKGQKLVNTISIDENKRGIHREWGFIGEAGTNIDTLLKEWANLNFFLKASVEADVGIRGQTPLNLFDMKEQAGLALQLQVIARAAIAIGLDIDLTIGELMKELQIYSNPDDFMTELLNIFFEETEIEGVMYAQVAIAVMAYTHLIITGSFFSNQHTENTPGFKMIFDAGYGFIAGGGYRCYVQVKMTNPRKLIYRTSELTVGECMKSVSSFSVLRIMEAPLKIGLRLAYMLGEELERNYLAGDPRVNQTIQVIIEEGQRWFLHQFNQHARDNLKSLITSMNMPTSIASNLLRKLDERAITTVEFSKNLHDIMSLSLAILPSLPPVYKESWLTQLCVIWSSMNLYISVSEEQLKDVPRYYHFHGSLGISIPETISNEINRYLGKLPSNLLQKEQLMTFLFDNALTSILQQQNNIYYVISIYKDLYSGSEQEVVQQLFNFAPLKDFLADRATLDKLFNGLYLFFQTHMVHINYILEQEMTEYKALSDMLNHSVFPSLSLVLEIIIPEILNGYLNESKIRRNMVEALSSALLPLIGRTLIQIQDGILSKTKDQLGFKLRQAGKELEHINLPQKFEEYDLGKFIVFDIKDYMIEFLEFVDTPEFTKSYINHIFKVMIYPMQHALEVMAEIIEKHPYPKSVFYDMEAILTPISNWKNTMDFYRNLTNDPNWLPQETKVKKLLEDLGKYMLIDMQKYNTQLISILLKAMLTKLLEDIEFVIIFIQNLLNTLLNLIGGELANKLSGPLGDFIEKIVGDDPLTYYHIPNKYLDKALNLLRDEINKGVINNIIPSITGALIKGDLDAKTIINALRGQELNSNLFREVIIEQIKNHLIEELDDTLGINVSFSVPIEDIIGDVADTIEDTIGDIGGGLYSHSHHSHETSIPINLGFISFSSIDIINIVINELLNNPLIDEQYKKLRFEQLIKFVYFLEEKPPIYEKTIPEIEKQYIKLTRNFPMIINIKDMLLIVQTHKEHTDHMEIFIHFPDNNVLTDNVIIKLNEIEISLDCFSFYDDTPFLNRQNSLLLYGVTPFYKLKSNINTLHVFYQDMESKLSFSIE
ncbi:hypothetical protein [Bacillus thuringiensis]|uniref:Uncharacterized protein n=1 Tax=Bacillus thuringiensis subsp. higo TaxID=132266 RepID=A0A9X6QV09_BACUH|nr:hypothetical protein [Bacillus thuringiensis]OUB58705.1 hypothetical protein BK716_04820 [Bacillus thuringiensis serovar higo]